MATRNHHSPMTICGNLRNEYAQQYVYAKRNPTNETNITNMLNDTTTTKKNLLGNNYKHFPSSSIIATWGYQPMFSTTNYGQVRKFPNGKRKPELLKIAKSEEIIWQQTTTKSKIWM
jgi:hypothetical protein